MRHQNEIYSVLQSHKILLDTSFAMQSGFPEFIQTYAPAFRRNPILIPTVVLWELRKHCRESRIDTVARSTLELMALLILSRQAQVRCEKCDRFQDLVILRVTLQHMLSHSIVVLTNDTDLMLDLRTMWRCKSVESDQHLEVLKIHGWTQRVCFFEEWDCRIRNRSTSPAFVEE